MADVLLSSTCLVGALGTYSIGMLRTELLSRKDEGLFDGYRVFKVVHLKEKTIIGHEFFAVFLRKGNTFIVVRIERRPGSPKGSSSDLWTDDSISRLSPNFDSGGYYHLSTTFCSSQKPLTMLGMCDVCALIRHAAPFYSVTKHKHCYWFCAAFLNRLSDLGYSTATSLEKGQYHNKRGQFAWKRLITEDGVSRELAAPVPKHQQKNRRIRHLLQFGPTHFRFNRERWSLEWELKGHTRHVLSVCFTLDGKHLLSGSVDNTIRTWDLSSGKDARRPLTGHAYVVKTVAVFPGGRHFGSASGDGTVRVWDLEAGTAASEPFKVHDPPARSVAFSPDGRNIVFSSYDNSLHICNVETGAAISEPLLGHKNWVSSVAWSPDGSHIISSSLDKTIRVWNVQTGALVGDPLLGHNDWVMSVCFSPDGSHIASGSHDETIRLWETLSGKAEGEPLRGHTGLVMSVAFSPDGHRIASGSSDNTVRIWESTSGGAGCETISLDARSSVYGVAWSPTGERIAAGCDDGMVRVWCKTAPSKNTSHRSFRTYISRMFGMQWTIIENFDTKLAVVAVRFTSDGRYLLSGGRDNTICKLDTTAGKEARQLAALEGHISCVNSIAVSPGGNYIVSASDDHTVRLWDLDGSMPIMEPFRGHTDEVWSAAFSPDGSKIVSGSLDKTLRIWDAKTGAAIGEPLLGHSDRVYSVAWSPDGSCIISGSDDCTIRVWDAQTGAPVGDPLLGHTGEVYSVCFSPDGKHFVSGSEDSTIRLWDTASRQPMGEPLRGHTYPVRSVAFSPDGRWIGSGSRDGTVRIWSILKSGRADGEVAMFNVDENINTVAWSPTGDVIAVACGRGHGMPYEHGKIVLLQRKY